MRALTAEQLQALLIRMIKQLVRFAVTGIVGPGGATAAKPVGLVHLACKRRGRPTTHERHVFPGTRGDVRAASVEAALRMLLRAATA